MNYAGNYAVIVARKKKFQGIKYPLIAAHQGWLVVGGVVGGDTNEGFVG